MTDRLVNALCNRSFQSIVIRKCSVININLPPDATAVAATVGNTTESMIVAWIYRLFVHVSTSITIYHIIIIQKVRKINRDKKVKSSKQTNLYSSVCCFFLRRFRDILREPLGLSNTAIGQYPHGFYIGKGFCQCPSAFIIHVEQCCGKRISQARMLT